MPIMRLTKRNIESLPFTVVGQVLYRDEELTGFGVRVGSKSKVFFVEGQVARRTVRVTIGKFGPLSPEVARKLALKRLAEMVQGRNPNAIKRQEQLRTITLREGFERFFAAKPNLSSSTVASYKRTVNLYLRSWAARSLGEITCHMVLAMHQQISEQNGRVTANYAMRHLRSVYNFLAVTHDDLPPNPVSVLSQARAWAPERRRRRLIPAEGLHEWWSAVCEENPAGRDFLCVALFTGMRRGEIAGLRWDSQEAHTHRSEDEEW